MKKLLFLFFSLLALGAAFQACSDSKTYAEMLEDERNAINKFIREHNINIISQEEFEKDTITDVSKNEYVLLSNGVYMQIVDRGTGDTLKSRDEVLVRFIEYDIMESDTTYASNYNVDSSVDAFFYTFNSSTSYGQFATDTSGGIESRLAWFYYNYYNISASNLSSVPAGWLAPLRYIKDRAHVKLIVPSKMGHYYGQQYVYPYFYDIRKYQIR
ncbi:DUF4827 domain-containing protein [Bacteroides sp. 224]|uniref:DUF4827 domain-containing protein n=1 Tax=Bacteroides sp. 224 TaxID=2302936 RepID=UPI0013D3E0E4|nr:DUF4827 domain-containing protein [Bacteroides sp. 224]NDV66968.1 DUF4827 domain-containing protein [Bacteroides sp. 224]